MFIRLTLTNLLITSSLFYLYNNNIKWYTTCNIIIISYLFTNHLVFEL